MHCLKAAHKSSTLVVSFVKVIKTPSIHIYKNAYELLRNEFPGYICVNMIASWCAICVELKNTVEVICSPDE